MMLHDAFSYNFLSALNIHLEDILYFLEATEYHIVLVEDLDRLNNIKIFMNISVIRSLSFTPGYPVLHEGISGSNGEPTFAW